MKYSLLYLFISVPVYLSGQQDTIPIREIIITGRQIPAEIPGFKKTSVDSLFQNNYSHLSFAELLSESSPVYIKSYGYGGSATTSFRGAGASHTQVTWNGININSPMPGQSDFSILVPGMSDNIHLSYGGASIYTGSGGFGGSVNLENKPVWSEKAQFYLSTGTGSFGHYSGSVRFRTGNSHFQTVTRLFMNASENNFPYINDVAASEPVRETRKNSRFRQNSFLEELYYKKGSGTLSAMIWYQSASRNLPGSMLMAQSGSGEKQNDESFRSIVGYESGKGKINYYLKGAWLVTNLDYTNRIASINSENNTNTFALKGGLETRIKCSTTINVTFNDEYTIVASNNYKENIFRNSASVTLSAQRKTGNRFGTSFLLRGIIDGQSLLLPDFAAGIEYRIFAYKDHFLKTGFSRNSRIPSMNDRYWNPGGNSSLKNEYALQYEAGYKLSRPVTESFTADAEITVFSTLVRDMIQWQPGEYSYWTARNIGNVNASGAESVISLKYKYNKINARLNAGYSFTRSVSGKRDDVFHTNQMMYIPINQANSSLNISRGRIYFFWITDFTGKRYITVDNTGFLPGYVLNNIISGLKIDLRKTSVDLNLRINNLFNSDYQTIAYHPQPGRSYFVTISFQMN